MFDFEKLMRYKLYLNTIDEVLKGYFEEQKEYIFCKKGCSHCCETGQYPLSELELQFLSLGFYNLPMVEQQNVLKKIKDLKDEYEKIENKEDYKYSCPFLNEEKSCTIYDYRPLICRTFGLLTITPKEKCVIPFCYSLGLNYSNVYDENNKCIDYEKVQNDGFKIFPNARKTNLKTLMAPEMFEGEPLQFGEIKSLVDWL